MFAALARAHAGEQQCCQHPRQTAVAQRVRASLHAIEHMYDMAAVMDTTTWRR